MPNLGITFGTVSADRFEITGWLGAGTTGAAYELILPPPRIHKLSNECGSA